MTGVIQVLLNLSLTGHIGIAAVEKLTIATQIVAFNNLSNILWNVICRLVSQLGLRRLDQGQIVMKLFHCKTVQ
jgi:hypothetical protein